MTAEGLNPGSEFDGYRIDRVIGRGGMGVVYAATELALSRSVALKVMSPSLADDAQFRAQFQRESRLAAAIGHAHVVPVYRAGEAGGRLFLAMQLIDGPSLDTVVPLPVDRAVRILGQVAAALDAAHSLGLVHRDVKPGNVLLAAGDHAYVTDFGLAIAHSDHVVQTAPGEAGDFAGSLDYMAPERIMGAAGDARADIYALGCLLYVTLTGRVPYPRDSPASTLFAHINDPVPVPSQVSPDLAVFDSILAVAMAKDPRERFATAGGFALALGVPPPVPAPPVVAAPAPVAPPPPSSVTVYASGYEPPLATAPGRRWRWPRLWRRPARPPAPPPALPAPATNGHSPSVRQSTDRLAEARRRAAAVRVPVSPTFRYVHHPFAAQEEDALPLLGNEEVVLALVERIMHSNGGAFLLTGFRGVGKTTVILSALDHLRAEIGKDAVVPVFLNVARPKSTEELLFEVIRRLYEALDDGGVLEQLDEEVRRQLILAYRRTSLSFTQTRDSESERTRGLGFGIPLPMLDAFKVDLSGKTTDSLAMEASFLAYSAADVEHDFLRIVSLFRRHGTPETRWNGKVVVVIDELDKLTVSDVGRASLDNLVSGLKNLLTTWGVHFVFIAGPDLHDLSMRHSHRGNSVYDSVFGWQLYVPCVWQATDRLLESTMTDGWEQRPEVASLPDYLRFKARGVPRLLLMELNSLVEWDGGRPCLTLRTPDRARIEFYAGVERVLAEFTGPGPGHAFAVAIDEDRWRIGAYYVTDWILRTLGRTFTARDVIPRDDGEDDDALDPLLVLVPEKVEALLEHLVTHGYVVRVRSLGAHERHFGDVPDAQVAVYKLADDVVAKLRAFARDNVQERADLLADGGGEIAAQPWESTRPGDVVGGGRYELQEEIDRGGMGRVYTARDRQRGQTVAVKMLDVPGLEGDETMRARFVRKAQIAKALEHPNIVPTLDMFTEEDGRLGIVMEFVSGTSLKQLMRQVRLEPSDAVAIAAALLDALDYLGHHDVVRLDLKPSSIMVRGKTDPVIVDIGLAKHESSTTKITESGDPLIGTPAYLAPEVITGAVVDGRADIYSVGMLLWEMLAGQPAREPGELFEVLRRAVAEDVNVAALSMASPELREVMGTMLARDPEHRWQTAGLARTALLRVPETASFHLAPGGQS
ncbi:MAG TPA: protein kinase [Solirubrobacteraceae bacterium]|nr:protein kinase [Solirubrobacteraceae bacterium]